MTSTAKVFIYTALACEAKPLVAYFGLKKEIAVRPFAVFYKNGLYLAVTGPGKNAMAAGVAFTQALYGDVENPVLINAGIAGHRDHETGKPFVAHKISDADNGKNYYPVLAYSPPCATAAIVTASKPQLKYDHEHLCDMEASAFYETAARFTSGELIQSIKVVSDNRASPAQTIDAKKASALIAQNTAVLPFVIDALKQLAADIVQPDTAEFYRLIRRYRFTVSEQNQLKSLLLRWSVLTDRELPDFDSDQSARGKDVLRWLERKINALGFPL